MTLYESSILDFSLSATPDERDLMAILTAFADESGKASDGASRCISFAAVIGDAESWKKFDRNWRRMLTRHQIPYLHMKEIIGAMKTGEGPFAKFADAGELGKLLSDVVACITGPGLFCCANAVWLADLKAMLKKYNIRTDPYSFTLYAAVVFLGTESLNGYPDKPAFQLILDRLEKGEKRVMEAKHLYMTDKFVAWRGWPAVTPLSPKDEDGSRKRLELQVADFVAWMMKRYLEYTEQWMREVKPSLGVNNFTAFTESLEEWLLAKVRAEESAISREFFRARILMSRRLKYYPYDSERLEQQIFKNRGRECPLDLRAETIARAGRQPLTP